MMSLVRPIWAGQAAQESLSMKLTNDELEEHSDCKNKLWSSPKVLHRPPFFINTQEQLEITGRYRTDAKLASGTVLGISSSTEQQVQKKQQRKENPGMT
jgi:hypothetical protein